MNEEKGHLGKICQALGNYNKPVPPIEELGFLKKIHTNMKDYDNYY